MIAFVGLMLTVIMGFSAMAVDIGAFAAEKRNLQNAADAMALAGAQDLPSEGAAASQAMSWAGKNGITNGDGDETNGEVDSINVYQQSLPGEPNPRITVTLRKEHRFTFARVIGIESAEVQAKASAIKTSPGGRDGIVPWGVKETMIAGAQSGELVTLKYDAQESANGNFGPIAVDRTGAGSCQMSDPLYGYLCAIKYGSNGLVCSEPAVAQGCEPTAPECTGAECSTEPGNKVGATRDGVDYRIDNTDATCDTFEEVFTSNGNGAYRLNATCNPFVAGSKPSLRVMIVPVIDDADHGRTEVTIKNFGLFFLEGYDSGKCTGNSCEVKGRFVKADINTGSLSGRYDAQSLIHFVRLVN